jgi:hypothetical protein
MASAAFASLLRPQQPSRLSRRRIRLKFLGGSLQDLHHGRSKKENTPSLLGTPKVSTVQWLAYRLAG